jgi:hypothetical protein
LSVAAVITMATMLGLTPQQKAALVVVSGLPALAGVAGVIVQKYDRDAPRPRGAFVVTDQEGGKVETFPQLPPRSAACTVRSKDEAFDSGRTTGRALGRIGVDVDLAPVLHFPGLGSLPPPAPVPISSCSRAERTRRVRFASSFHSPAAGSWTPAWPGSCVSDCG